MKFLPLVSPTQQRHANLLLLKVVVASPRHFRELKIVHCPMSGQVGGCLPENPGKWHFWPLTSENRTHNETSQGG